MCVAARWAHDEMWYRARVLGFRSPATVRLAYVDYGSVAEVEWSKVSIGVFQNKYAIYAYTHGPVTGSGFCFVF